MWFLKTYGEYPPKIWIAPLIPSNDRLMLASLSVWRPPYGFEWYFGFSPPNVCVCRKWNSQGCSIWTIYYLVFPGSPKKLRTWTTSSIQSEHSFERDRNLRWIWQSKCEKVWLWKHLTISPCFPRLVKNRLQRNWLRIKGPGMEVLSDLWIPIRPSERANLTRKSRDMSLRQHNRCPNRIHSPDIHGRAHLLVKLVLRKHGPRILTAGWLKNFRPGEMSRTLGHHFQEKILKAWENFFAPNFSNQANTVYN